MAPRFKKNMFYCWRKDAKTTGLIGFTSLKEISIFDFRDKLITVICENKEFIINKQKGEPTPLDSVIRLFDVRDKELVQIFFSRKFPKSFSAIFKTKYYLNWKKEWDTIMKLVKVELETSHDFPCLVIHSQIHSPDELTMKLKKVSNALLLELYENRELNNIENVITSNRTFGLT